MYPHTRPQCWYDCYTRVTTQITLTFIVIPQLTHKTYKSEKNAFLTPHRINPIYTTREFKFDLSLAQLSPSFCNSILK